MLQKTAGLNLVYQETPVESSSYGYPKTTVLIDMTVHMFLGKMLILAILLKLARRGLEGTSFPPSDPQTCI